MVKLLFDSGAHVRAGVLRVLGLALPAHAQLADVMLNLFTGKRRVFEHETPV